MSILNFLALFLHCARVLQHLEQGLHEVKETNWYGVKETHWYGVRWSKGLPPSFPQIPACDVSGPIPHHPPKTALQSESCHRKAFKYERNDRSGAEGEVKMSVSLQSDNGVYVRDKQMHSCP